MKQPLLPAIWLITLIVGLPQLSETVYTPSLPDIARALQTSDAMVEYTLTIYLFGFAVGTLFWGKISDRLGRKPCMIAGLAIYLLGCVGCYFSDSILMLMASRLVQAFGGSVGSVLGQAIGRDAFHGPRLGKVYSSIGSALAIFPAIGPVIGGFIAESFGWQNIFIFLVLFGLFVNIMVIFRLPETHSIENRQRVGLMEVISKMLRDRKVIGFGLLIAGCNGIGFSYFAEAPFYLIEVLGLSPSKYGLSFLATSSAAMLGGMISKRLHNHHTSNTILHYGLKIILAGSAAFSIAILCSNYILSMPKPLLIAITILSQMVIMFGMCIAISNALALSLVDYKWCVGTAASIFGFFYYAIISLFTLGMGALHNGTLIPMPLYFLAISLFMMLVRRVMA